MLARCAVTRAARSVPSRLRPCLSRRVQATSHRYASTTHGTAPGAGQIGGAVPSMQPGQQLAALIDELDTIAPRFELEDDSIEILEGPVQFYEALKGKILEAKRRIYLSTLYIGKTEYELISTVRAALQNNPDLKISFLADALRGTRETPEPTTASILAPLVSEFGAHRVRIRLYHTPNLTGLKKRMIPNRINEGWGLQHMKLYGIDDEIILSGANLSQDYFTNRLDRYHVFRSQELTDYYERVHEAVSSISFDVQPDTENKSGYIMSWPSTNPGPDPLQDKQGYIAHASALLASLIKPSLTQASKCNQSALQPLSTSTSTASTKSTFVYPIFQLTPLLPSTPDTQSTQDNSTEVRALTTLLTHLRQPALAPADITFTAGYFNPSPGLIDLLLSAAVAAPHTNTTPTPRLDVIAASPYANGFYNSRGISGMLPAAYTLLSRRFLAQAHRRTAAAHAPADAVRLREWRRGTVGAPGAWTYHAKGIWATLRSSSAEAATPLAAAVTVVGSSNYSQRSAQLDLEAGALVLTRDAGLQARLAAERGWLGADAAPMALADYEATERRVSLRVRIAMWIVGRVGGAL